MGCLGDSFTLQDPLDMHVHFRTGDMLKAIAPLTAQHFSGALIMPNVVPKGFDPSVEIGITNREMLAAYLEEIDKAIQRDFAIMPTLFFQTSYDYDFLLGVQPHIRAIKFYPRGMTTNSHGGCCPNDPAVLPILKFMEDLGIVLCVHGETTGFVMDREKNFMKHYETWAYKFPKLKIVMEHITTKDAIETLARHPNLYATITVHHLLITLDDVAGGLLNPHLFCKPIAKRPEDLWALRDAVFNRGIRREVLDKIMLGTDSAPHPQSRKESACGCAGVFTAPIALQILAQEFDGHGTPELFQEFVSDRAKRIYGLNVFKKQVTLVKKRFQIPPLYGNMVVPMWAGKTLEWSVQDVSGTEEIVEGPA
jgi:dihydroorotase